MVNDNTEQMEMFERDFRSFNAGIPDIQKTPDERNIYLPKVGVCGVKVPLSIYQKEGGVMNTVADFSMYVGVRKDQRGTHMSRFTQVLGEHLHGKTIACDDFKHIIIELARRLEAPVAQMKVEMDYFLSKPAPVTKVAGVAPYRAWFTIGHSPAVEGAFHCSMGVKVVGQTYCPCSKEISDYDSSTGKGKGAHAQHGNVTINITHELGKKIWIEDLIELAESSVSAPAYPVLKRVDEKFVTIQGYENPCFVEDVLRNCYQKLMLLRDITGFEVEVENDEVIHFHKAAGKVAHRYYVPI